MSRSVIAIGPPVRPQIRAIGIIGFVTEAQILVIAIGLCEHPHFHNRSSHVIFPPQGCCKNAGIQNRRNVPSSSKVKHAIVIRAICSTLKIDSIFDLYRDVASRLNYLPLFFALGQ